MKIAKLLLIICLFFSQLTLLKAQTTIVLKPNATNGKDAYITTKPTTSNYGTHPDFMASAWTAGGSPFVVRSLIEFDLTSIPNGAIVTSARLSLYSYSSPSHGSHSTLSGSNATVLQRITSPWSENSVTWSNQPSTTVLHQATLPASTSSIQNYNVDVTVLTQDMINNRTSSFGFLLKLVNEQHYRRMVFASSDNSNPSLFPQIEITYTLPVVTQCIALRPNADQGKDAYISTYSSSTNYGSHADFIASAWTSGGSPFTVRNLINFDLTSIPDGATINSAKLSLYSYDSPSHGSHSPLSGSNAAVLQRIVSPWMEDSVTWDNQPSTTSLNQATLPASTSSIQNYNIDVKALTQDMINNRNNSFGFLLKLVTEEYYRRLVFGSSDNSDASLHPQLEICYSYSPVLLAQSSINNTNSLTNTGKPASLAKNIVKSEISIFPNPTRNGIINVASQHKEANITQLNVYTTRGKLVKSILVNNKLNSISLGNSVSPGLYFIKVYSTKGEVHSQSLLVE